MPAGVSACLTRDQRTQRARQRRDMHARATRKALTKALTISSHRAARCCSLRSSESGAARSNGPCPPSRSHAGAPWPPSPRDAARARTAGPARVFPEESLVPLGVDVAGDWDEGSGSTNGDRHTTTLPMSTARSLRSLFRGAKAATLKPRRLASSPAARTDLASLRTAARTSVAEATWHDCVSACKRACCSDAV